MHFAEQTHADVNGLSVLGWLLPATSNEGA